MLSGGHEHVDPITIYSSAYNDLCSMRGIDCTKGGGSMSAI